MPSGDDLYQISRTIPPHLFKPMAVSISQNLSAKFRTLSFVCALLVVLLHAYTQTMDSMTGPLHLAGWFLSVGICGIAVPFFFIVSGYLLAHQADDGIPFSKLVTKRLKSLGLPYLYWCLLYTFSYVAFTVYGNHIAGRMLNTNTSLVLPLTNWQNPFRLFGFDMFLFPANGPLWYVRNLLMLVLVSPLLLKAMKRKVIALVLLGAFLICYLGHFLIPRPWWQFFQTGFSFKGLLFFALGIYLKRFPVYWKPNLAMTLGFCLVWFLLAWPWKLPSSYAFLCLHLSFPVGCLALWYLYDFLPFRLILEKMRVTKYSFFIFASHYAILNILFCQKACDLLKKHLINSELMIYLLRFIVTAVLSIVLAYLLERFIPKLYKALTGGR